MIVLLAGENTFERQEEFDRLRAQHNQDGALATNTIVLEGARTSLAELRQAAQTVPFLADYRMVRVDGLAKRLGGGRRGGGGPWAALGDCLTDVPPTTIMVFVEGRLGQRDRLRQAVQDAGGEIHIFGRRTGRDLDGWVSNRARGLGLHLTAVGRQELLQRIGDDQWILASELRKLRLYAGEDAVDDTIVASLVPAGFNSTIWDLVDGVAERNPARALQALDVLRRDGEEARRIPGMIARQFRMIATAREILDRGGGVSEVQSTMGLQPFVARKTVAQAERYDQAAADAALARILDADLAIQHFRQGREGGMREDLALELLFTELAHGFAWSPRAAAGRA